MAGLVAHRTDLSVQEILGVGQVLPGKKTSQRYILHCEVVYSNYLNAKKLRIGKGGLFPCIYLPPIF